MASTASALGMPATAFVHGSHLRWFSPLVELEVCGHATLATAFVDWSLGSVEPFRTYTTAAGPLTVRRDGGWIELDLESQPTAPEPAPRGLESILGAVPRPVWRSPLDLLVELDSAGAVQAIEPDLAAIRGLSYRGVIVTAAGTEGSDYVTRFFAPARGIAEDAATGSIQAALGPFWARRLGKKVLSCRQLSARGGTMRVRVGDQVVAVAGRVLPAGTREITPPPGP